MLKKLAIILLVLASGGVAGLAGLYHWFVVLHPGEQYVVDTGHLVAWEAQMQYQLRKASKSGYFRSFLSGEGMVAEFVGPGEILIQTRNLAAFAGLLKPFFPSQGSGGGFSFGS